MRTFDQELRQAIAAAGFDLKGAGPATVGNEGRTMAALAKKANVEPTFISRLKDGKKPQVVEQVAAVARLAAALGTTVERLAAGINAAYEAPDSQVRPSSKPHTK
jgi:transcriptional regulator with XRE-family HTH domain